MLDTLPRSGGRLQTTPGPGGTASVLAAVSPAGMAPQPPDPARVARARGGPGCGSRSTLRLIPGRTPNARPAGGHVHHDACRCDGTRKTIPGWEYQFTAAVGHLRTAWAALIDVERTTPATRTRQTARQVQNLVRRLHAAGTDGRGAPLPSPSKNRQPRQKRPAKPQVTG